MNEALVLTYHGILPEIPSDQPPYEYRNFVESDLFEKQLHFLLKNYRPLRITDFFDPDVSLRKGFFLTFDDGYRNNHSYALPILNKYGLQACFFVTTNLVGTHNFLWTDQVTRLIHRTRKSRLKLHSTKKFNFNLNGDKNREITSEKLRAFMKSIHPDMVEDVFNQLFSQLSDVDRSMGRDEEERYLFLNWDEIRDMRRQGHIIGSHTHTHPILSTLTEQESYRELKISKEIIEKQTGQPCLVFSYPNGEKKDYKELQKKQLKELGYQCAFTSIRPFDGFPTSPYELCRVNISRKMPMPVFEAVISGFKKR
ncbi:MAG: polysaccharide deacetylase family protein [Calditrichia bacterium]